MDRLHLMTVFVAVAEEESFTAAARRLRLSAPAVTRAIGGLEQALKVKLLNRTTRFVRLTDVGQGYLEDARRILAAIDEADEAAAGINAEPRGHLAITAPVSFGRLYVLPGLLEYLRRYPETEVSALFLDRVVNLVEEGVDVGVRIGELPDSSLKALRVGQVRRVLCAAPSYLQQYGKPTSPADLEQHQTLVATNLNPKVEWSFCQHGQTMLIKVKPRLRVTNNDAVVEAAIAGAGIARLVSYQVAESVAAGKLEIILPDYEPAPMPVQVIHREGRYASAKIRTLVDLLVQRLRADLSLNEPF